MSDIMWDDTRYKIDWHNIVRWDDRNIKGFFGPYRWLSNWWRATVWFEGWQFDCVETAYMGQKTLDPIIRSKIQRMSAQEAKKFSNKIVLRPGWDEMKYDVMLECVFQKFLKNPELRKKLIETGDKYLEETNYWKCVFWGVDVKLGGQNNLGKILMKVRECLK